MILVRPNSTGADPGFWSQAQTLTKVQIQDAGQGDPDLKYRRRSRILVRGTRHVKSLTMHMVANFG